MSRVLRKFPLIVKAIRYNETSAVSLTLRRATLASFHNERITDRLTIFRCAFGVLVWLTVSAVWLQRQTRAITSEISQGKNWKAVEARIADGFQSVHPNRVRDRAGELSS
jgi:hypothetical protein